MTQRRCFLMQLKPDRVQDYLTAHKRVWPDMLDALQRAGYRNYSLFLREADGLVVGYFEAHDPDEAARRMQEEEVNARWQAAMAPYFVSGRNPDESVENLSEYFHLT